VRKIRKPLIVMTPKSLLRHPQAVSSLQELSQGTFQRILPDTTAKSGKKTRRILMCSGKVYYELAARRDELKLADVPVLRLEQLYPLREDALTAALAPYPAGTPLYWVQEEPANMGAWYFLRARYGDKLLGKYPLTGIARPASASPATGSPSSHRLEQQKLLEDAFAGL
jgi:2-oxoglutarate dehydrogenase E1 component